MGPINPENYILIGDTMNHLKDLVEKKIPFLHRMGLTLLEARPCYTRLMAPMKGNENHIGTMYAGALFTLAEVPGGVIALSTFDPSRFYPVVKNLTMEFKAPVTTDAFIEIEISREEAERILKEADENGKADFELNAEIKNAEGAVVALSRGLYQIRKI